MILGEYDGIQFGGLFASKMIRLSSGSHYLSALNTLILLPACLSEWWWGLCLSYCCTTFCLWVCGWNFLVAGTDGFVDVVILGASLTLWSDGSPSEGVGATPPFELVQQSRCQVVVMPLPFAWVSSFCHFYLNAEFILLTLYKLPFYGRGVGIWGGCSVVGRGQNIRWYGRRWFRGKIICSCSFGQMMG